MPFLLKLLCVLIVCGGVRIAAARFGNRLAACLLGFPTLTSLLTAVNLNGLRSCAVQDLAEAGLAGTIAATGLATTFSIVSPRSRNALATWGISMMTYTGVVVSAQWIGLVPFWLQAIVIAMLLMICGTALCCCPLAESNISSQRRGTLGLVTLLLPGVLVVMGECVQRIGQPLVLALVATFPAMTCSQLAFSQSTNGMYGPLLLVRRLPFTNLSTLAFWVTLRISVTSMSIESAFVLSLFLAAVTLTCVVCVIDLCLIFHRKKNREETPVSDLPQKFAESHKIHKNSCPVAMPLLASNGVTIQVDDQRSHQHVLVN